MTITEAAKATGRTPEEIIRLVKAGKIKINSDGHIFPWAAEKYKK